MDKTQKILKHIMNNTVLTLESKFKSNSSSLNWLVRWLLHPLMYYNPVLFVVDVGSSTASF